MRISRRNMTVLATLLAMLIAVPAFAQAQRAQVNTGLGIGALGGWTFTSVRTDTNEFSIDTKGDSGYMFGIWFGGNRDGRVGVMGEVSWVVKRVSYDDAGETFNQKLSYVEIPVLARINAGARDRNKPSLYFMVGPVFDIQVKNELDGDSVDDFYEGLDIGAMVGVGFEVVRIGIEGRYSWGLRSVLGTDAAEEAGFGSTKQNTLQILFKIRFN